MDDVLSAANVKAGLELLAKELYLNAASLDVMDSLVGDGDHGTSVATLFSRALSDIDFTSDSAGELLRSLGNSLMFHCVGASGTLYASLFAALGEALAEYDAIALSQFAPAFRSSLDQIEKFGGAAVGDATMIDAIEPFVEALNRGVASGASLASTMRVAAEDAQRGADSTKEMVAKFGRARGFGANSQGHLDPGACSFAIMAAALAEVM